LDRTPPAPNLPQQGPQERIRQLPLRSTGLLQELVDHDSQLRKSRFLRREHEEFLQCDLQGARDLLELVEADDASESLPQDCLAPVIQLPVRALDLPEELGPFLVACVLGVLEGGAHVSAP
jgi:hypothetical protein